ncbi:hypothetical protein PG987_004923 [Apiospora arundinis]
MSASAEYPDVELIREAIIVDTQSTQSTQSTQPAEPATEPSSDEFAITRPSRRRPTTRSGRAAAATPRFRFSHELRGSFMGLILQTKRDGRLNIVRPAEMQKAFQRVAQQMISTIGGPPQHWTAANVRKRYLDCRKRWNQWQQAERSGTGPDQCGYMDAPKEVLERLYAKDPSARWMESEPLLNIPAYVEVFGRDCSTGRHIHEAGEPSQLSDSHIDTKYVDRRLRPNCYAGCSFNSALHLIRLSASPPVSSFRHGQVNSKATKDG